MNLPVPYNKLSGPGSAGAVKERHVDVEGEYIDVAEGRISQMTACRHPRALP
jgi:hypothetical protein